MDQDVIVTTRLHVSGLTPAITQADLSQRLSTFGTVEALDGFGQLDGVGQPRRFAYVTFKAPKRQLARCLNLLSGTTWKGAKLRIGEAKPDFKERLAHELSRTRPKKRRRLARGIQGVHAPDMSLVTPENVHLRKGWHVTPLGRLIRPTRMRPLKPLPPPVTHSTDKRDTGTKKKPKRRFKQALMRARRRTINPLKWGSQHLKGAFLNPMNVIIVRKDGNIRSVSHTGDEQEDYSDDSADEPQISATLDTGVARPRATNPDVPEASGVVAGSDLAAEKMESLSLLESMFGRLHEDREWGGEETIDSDVEMRDAILSKADLDESVSESSLPVTKNKLKDLFAPQEEQGFSLLGHLDLDLELDDGVIAPIASEIQAPIDVASVLRHEKTSHAQIAFDPKQPLFFPLRRDARNTKGKGKDIKDVLKDRGFDWRQGFYRTESSEEISKRWEETKGELTRDWKRRHREAVKSRRRRGGGDGDP